MTGGLVSTWSYVWECA